MSDIYIIVLNNGVSYEIKADEVEWDINAKNIGFIADRMIVARFNHENIAGLINKRYVVTDTEGRK